MSDRRQREATVAIRKFFQSRITAINSFIDKPWVLDSLFLVGAVFFLVLLRPFGMSNIGFVQSAIYWVLICAIGSCLFWLIYMVGHEALERFNWKYPYPLIALTGIAAVLMGFVVPFVWSAFFGRRVDYAEAFFRVLPQTLTIGVIVILVAMARDHVKRQKHFLNQKSHEQDSQDAVQNFVKRLPRKMQGELLCIGTDDHYLKVHTDKGQHMLLMPLTDAVKELEGAQGLRVHRSWWVSESAVLGSVKNGSKISLTLKNNMSVPVSRSYLKQVKERHLL